MSVWGKVGGAAAGLFVGGPVGALVGAVAGHFILDREADPGVTFTIAVVALAGKMARADGVVTETEWRLYEAGTVPEWTTEKWYAEVERAPHLEDLRVVDRFGLDADFQSIALLDLEGFLEGRA